MTEKEEAAFVRGQKSIYRKLLSDALDGLSVPDAPKTKAALLNRVAMLEMVQAETIAALRTICEEFGDNDWDDDLHPADVIEKHLARPLRDGNGPLTVR